MRELHFDLRRLQKDDRQGSHGSRRARRYVLAQAAETLHQLGYHGLRAKGLKGRHVEALVAEWRRQGLTDGTVKNRLAYLRWLARKIGKPGIVRRDNASYGRGDDHVTRAFDAIDRGRGIDGGGHHERRGRARSPRAARREVA